METETFQFDLNQVEVWLVGSSSTTTTVTATTTTNTQIQALLTKVQALESMGHDAKIEDLEALLTEFVQNFEQAKQASATRESALQKRVAELETAASISQAKNEEFDAFKEKTESRFDELTSRFQTASDRVATAGEASDDDETGGDTQTCAGDECIPTIEADGGDIVLRAPGGKVQLQSDSCKTTADLCVLQKQVAAVLDAVYAMGSD